MKFVTKSQVFFVLIFAISASAFRHSFRHEYFNRELVLGYFQEFFVDQNVESADRYLAPGPNGYIQHNPLLPNGRDALKEAATQWFTGNWSIQLLRVSSGGDLVWLHTRTESESLIEFFGGNGTVAAVDIYRVAMVNGTGRRIVEHWDVVQALPESSANDQPMF